MDQLQALDAELVAGEGADGLAGVGVPDHDAPLQPPAHQHLLRPRAGGNRPLLPSVIPPPPTSSTPNPTPPTPRSTPLPLSLSVISPFQAPPRPSPPRSRWIRTQNGPRDSDESDLPRRATSIEPAKAPPVRGSGPARAGGNLTPVKSRGADKAPRTCDRTHSKHLTPRLWARPGCRSTRLAATRPRWRGWARSGCSKSTMALSAPQLTTHPRSSTMRSCRARGGGRRGVGACNCSLKRKGAEAVREGSWGGGGGEEGRIRYWEGLQAPERAIHAAAVANRCAAESASADAALCRRSRKRPDCHRPSHREGAGDQGAHPSGRARAISRARAW